MLDGADLGYEAGETGVAEHPEATKERLLEAAGQVFADHGFQGATVREICRRAGANVAAVNYHFGDKDRLYAQAVLAAHRCVMEPMPDGPPADIEPARLLRTMVHHMLKSILAVDRVDSWQHALILREMIRPTAAADQLVEASIRPRFEALAGILQRLRPDLEGRSLNATVFSVVGQCLHYRMACGFSERLVGAEAFAALDLDFLTDHITRFTLAGLGCAAPDRGEGR